MLAVTVAWTATCRSYPPLRNHDPRNPNWEPCGPKLRCMASISVPRLTQCLHRSEETVLRPWTCVPYHPPCIRRSRRLSLNQRVASVDLDANACRRTVVTWCSCPWRWHRLNTHLKTSKPTNASSHKRQQWIYKPWTERRCRSLNPARYSLPAMSMLAQHLSCYNASLISNRCPPRLTIRCDHDNSFAIDTLRCDRPPGVHLCAAIGKCSLDHCHARFAHDHCKPSCTHAGIYPNQPDRASGSSTAAIPATLTPVYVHGCLRLATCRLPIFSSLALRSRRGGISTMHVNHCMFMPCAHGDPCYAIGPTCISNRMPANSWNIS